MAKPNDISGQKFGILTVTKRAENDGKYVAWYCDCDCGTKDFVARGNELKRKKIRSCGCKKEEEFDLEEKREKEAKKKEKEKEAILKMSEQEKKDWDELYQYVRVNIMGYDESQALSKQMVLRLKGLLTNKFIENKKTENTANYSYKTILNTFKFCSPTIQNALRTNRFRDEMHKFNFILKIVEQNINDIYIRMKNVQKAKEEAEIKTVEVFNHVGAKFKPREKKKDKFSDLW